MFPQQIEIIINILLILLMIQPVMKQIQLIFSLSDCNENSPLYVMV